MKHTTGDCFDRSQIVCTVFTKKRLFVNKAFRLFFFVRSGTDVSEVPEVELMRQHDHE